MKKLLYVPSFLILTTFLIYQSCSKDEQDPPQANFTFTSDNDFHAPSTVTFTNKSVAAKEYTWDFGDGSAASSEPHPVHVYEHAGSYTVTLTAKNKSLSDSKTATIDIVSFTPTADFSIASDNDFHTPSVITFTNKSTNVTTYSWDFGDGSDPSGEKDPVHTYAQSGTYIIKLSVSNETLNAEKSDTIEITPFTPEANFTYTSDHEFISPTVISFTNTSVHASGVSWDFGDGSEASTEENPVHTYSAPGNYTVTLTATNEDLTNTKTDDLVISAPAYTGKYKLTSAVLTEDVSAGGNVYPSGTDVTDVAMGLFDIVSCSNPAARGMDLRPDGTIYFVCTAGSDEVKAGSWSSSPADESLTLTFSAPPYPEQFTITLKNITESDTSLSGELIEANIPGSIVGFPDEDTVQVSCALTFEKI